MNLSKEKFLIKRHSERSHAVAKSKNLGSCVIASLVRGAAISCLLFLAACGDDPKVGGTEEDAGIIAIENKTVSGVSQKGPFVNGSSVTVYGLDGETLAQTGNIYEGKIRSDMGDFSVKVVKLASQYALLKANGFYRNEVTGEKSNSQMTLYALTDLSDRDEVNVNLLTHLAYERSLYLATNSMSVASAKAQAEAEVFKSFEIEGDFASAEDLNIFGENDQSAALLAISVMMQGDLKEADFSERLDNYARDIETDGVWDDKNTATFIADWASEKSLSGGLASVRANVEKWGQLFGVPPFEKYVNNFWWQNYGLGTCDAKREGEVKINSNALSANNGVHFICNNGGWRVATDLEKDTATWGAGKFDGEIRAGQINKENYYIYETNNKAWRDATTLEKDTYDYKENKAWTGKDGDSHYGVVDETNCYVFEDKAWRSGNDSDCSLDLRGCTSLRQDTVGLGKDKVWYICDMKNWRTATNIEKDTATWGAGKFDGEVRAGQVNKNIYYIYKTNRSAWREATSLEYDTYQKKCTNDGVIFDGVFAKTNKYVCDKDVFRVATKNEVSVGLGCTSYTQGTYWIPKGQYSFYKCHESVWMFATEKLNYGEMVDPRDGKKYKTIGINKHKWLAENLNYKMESGSSCYDNDENNCSMYGRLYTYEASLESCPSGWHVPECNEWKELLALELTELMEELMDGEWCWGCDQEPGSERVEPNVYGFSARPAGVYRFGREQYEGLGKWAYFWSSSGDTFLLGGDYYGAAFLSDYGHWTCSGNGRNYGMNSVRCVKDEE